jgi:hypothetical protein
MGSFGVGRVREAGLRIIGQTFGRAEWCVSIEPARGALLDDLTPALDPTSNPLPPRSRLPLGFTSASVVIVHAVTGALGKLRSGRSRCEPPTRFGSPMAQAASLQGSSGNCTVPRYGAMVRHSSFMQLLLL